MSADKSRAEVWADMIEASAPGAAAELRRIRVLEDQRDAANEAANGMHAMVCAEVEKVKALEAERDQLHAEVMEQARLLGMSGERELSLRAEIDRLRKDADRMDWLADPANTIGNVQLPRECVEQNLHSLRDAIDAARKQQ